MERRRAWWVKTVKKNIYSGENLNVSGTFLGRFEVPTVWKTFPMIFLWGTYRPSIYEVCYTGYIFAIQFIPNFLSICVKKVTVRNLAAISQQCFVFSVTSQSLWYVMSGLSINSLNKFLNVSFKNYFSILFNIIERCIIALWTSSSVFQKVQN